MVSSGEDPIDTTAGGLVWVRRRNGSWWPGQVLDPDNLPEGCVPTPRAGTPVKLLGREDASVDWYNLEKSKRVKAFRCKEYEVCIKRVQMMASLATNKRPAKYARREDAILHALELEKARLGRDHPDAQDTTSHATEDENEDLNSSRASLESGNVDSEAENDSEEDGVKRMRGLEDLGMGIASRKRAHVQELSKRKKRRPLTKVMECASMVSVPGEDSNGSKRNSSVVINNNSDSNGVSSENGDTSLKNATFSGPTIPETGSFQKLLLDVVVSAGKNPSAIISDASRQKQGGDLAQSSSLGTEACNDESGSPPTFGWRLKGKRKSRSRKRYVNIKTQTSVAGSSRRKAPPADNADGGTLRQRVLPLRQSRFTSNPKYDNSDYSLDNRAASGLCDVKVEAKASYRPQHVPYISLMSQLTGRPITGHPLQVTVLKDEKSELEDVPTPANKRRGGKRKRKWGSSRAQTSKSRSSNGLLSKKTRKLSSLTGHEETKVTKPIVEKVESPSVACVPLSVVFSRINADLNRTPPCPNGV